MGKIRRHYGGTVVEVFDPPSNDLPELFRTRGRYRLAFLVSVKDNQCKVNFGRLLQNQPLSNGSLATVPVDRVYNPRPLATNMGVYGGRVHALVRLDKDEFLTWVAVTLSGQTKSRPAKASVDLVQSGQTVVLSAVLFSNANFPDVLFDPDDRAAARLNANYRHIFIRRLELEYDYSMWKFCGTPCKRVKTDNSSPVQSPFANIPWEFMVKIAQQMDILERKTHRRLNRSWNSVLTLPSMENNLIINMGRYGNADPFAWTFFSFLQPHVQNIVMDWTNSSPTGFRGYDDTDVFRYIAICAKSRNLSLKSVIFLRVDPFHIKPAPSYFYNEPSLGIVQKLRFVHSTMCRVYAGCTGKNENVYIDDGEIEIAGKTRLTREIAKFLDCCCGQVDPLSEEEIQEMQDLAKVRTGVPFRLNWILSSEVEDQRDLANIGAYTVKHLRKLYHRVYYEYDSDAGENDW